MQLGREQSKQVSRLTQDLPLLAPQLSSLLQHVQQALSLVVSKRQE